MEERTRLGARLVLLAGIAGVFAFVILAFNTSTEIAPKVKAPWKTGYWVWAGGSPAPAKFEAEILYVEAPGRRWPRCAGCR